jgi:hypothetical protein
MSENTYACGVLEQLAAGKCNTEQELAWRFKRKDQSQHLLAVVSPVCCVQLRCGVAQGPLCLLHFGCQEVTAPLLMAQPHLRSSAGWHAQSAV